jgi:hypothetical protein
MGLRRLATARKLNPLRLISINFNILALMPHLHCAETTLEFSDNKIFLAICRIQTGVVGKEG